MDIAVRRGLTPEQRVRIEDKIRGIGADILYLVRMGSPVPVMGGHALQGTDYQRRRAEILVQVLEIDNVESIKARAAKTFLQAKALMDAGEQALGEERELQAKLLLWAMEPAD